MAKTESEGGVKILDPQGCAIQVRPKTPPATQRDRTALDLIAEAARDPTVDVDKFDRLMQMQERIVAREQEHAFSMAMMTVQEQIERVVTDKKNNSTSSRYASFSALDRVVRPIYTKNGFSISFNTDPSRSTRDDVTVVATVRHIGGHAEKYDMTMPADGKGAKGGDVMTRTHAHGSAVTYGRRYLLIMIFNIAIVDGNDDDGNRAGGKALNTISTKQAETIIDLCGRAHRSNDQLLAYLNGSSRPKGHPVIKSVSEIPVTRYAEVITVLENIGRKNAKN